MLKITTSQMRKFDQVYFYSKLDQFIIACCRYQKLLSLLSDTEKLHSIWSAYWNRACMLCEHDCALCLILLAVCECEGIAQKFSKEMVDHINENEVKAKQFIAGRGYFRFSDFDFVEVSAEGDLNA